MELPVELLLHIFSYCEPGIKAMLILSHTCQRWRSITLDNGSLWTKLDINIRYHRSKKALNNFISLLDVQLDRAQQSPLEVFWYRHGFNDRNSTVLDLLRQKAPFSRWRTLTVYFEYGANAPEPTIASTDAFTQLESLTIISSSFNSILRCIDRTVTSKLRALDLSRSDIPDDRINTLCENMLKMVRTLILPYNRSSSVPGPLLPENIVELGAGTRSVHHFSHVKRYKITYCVFNGIGRVDLNRLTSLTVGGDLKLYSGVDVLLPSLQHLEFGTIYLSPEARINTPGLQTLHVRAIPNSNINRNRDQTTKFEWSTFHSGYLLSPKRSMKLDLCVSQESLVCLLEKMQHVEVISVCLDSPSSAIRLVECLGGAIGGEADAVLQGERSCPKLVELGIKCLWEGCDAEGWRRRFEEMMGQPWYERKPLRIHVSTTR